MLQGAPPREEFDMRWVAEFVDKLSAFDCEMNVPVMQSGILEGMAQGDLTQAGQSALCWRCFHAGCDGGSVSSRPAIKLP